MSIHRDLPNSELHEPKHIQTATSGGDAGKVIVAKGDGTSELRKLTRTDIADVDSALIVLEDLAEELTGASIGASLSGVYLNAAATTGTVDVTVEGKQFYFIGPTAGQTVTVQMPDPTTTTGAVIVKRLSDAGTLTIIPFASEQIEEETSITLIIKNNAVTLVSDGTDWRFI